MRVKNKYKSEMYFLTFTVVNWQRVLLDNTVIAILIDALKYYQINRNLRIYSWVIMNNHMHLIVKSDNVINFIRSFKSYTSHEIRKLLKKSNPELESKFIRSNEFHFWQPSNMPELIESEYFFWQKVRYIEENPTRKGLVDDINKWKYSSANPRRLIKLDDIDDL